MPGAASSRRPLAFISLRRAGAAPATGRRRPAIRTSSRQRPRRSCSSSPTSPSSPRRRIDAPPSVTALSGPSSIRSWSRVRSVGGIRSSSAAGPRASQKGTCTAGRRVPSARLEPAPELAPRDRLRPTELERRRGPLRLDRDPYAAGEIVDPDGLNALGPRADHRRHRSKPRDAQQARESAPVDPEDEARAEHRVVDTGRRDRLFGRPFGAEVRDGRARPGPERAHEDDPADIALAGRLDEIAGADRHHALERRRASPRGSRRGARSCACLGRRRGAMQGR